MTLYAIYDSYNHFVSTHMPLARHDDRRYYDIKHGEVSTHMPLARHDPSSQACLKWGDWFLLTCLLRGMTSMNLISYMSDFVSTHMPLARHDIQMSHIIPLL